MTLLRHEPKVVNDLDEIIQGREDRWRKMNQERAHWATRGTYFEHMERVEQARYILTIIAIITGCGALVYCVFRFF